jgi:hypothetical protein
MERARSNRGAKLGASARVGASCTISIRAPVLATNSVRAPIGALQLRLLELSRDLDHPHWCTTGHLGYVLEGEMEVESATGSQVFRAGDGLAIPAGDDEKHRPRTLTERVRMIFVEDVS